MLEFGSSKLPQDCLARMKLICVAASTHLQEKYFLLDQLENNFPLSSLLNKMNYSTKRKGESESEVQKESSGLRSRSKKPLVDVEENTGHLMVNGWPWAFRKLRARRVF